MFNNPGKKLKSLAKLIFWLAIVLNVLLFLGIYGTAVVEEGAKGSALALFVFVALGLLIGALIGWLSSILLYAFGELIEDIHSMRKQINRIEYRLSKIPIIQGTIEEDYIEDDEE